MLLVRYSVALLNEWWNDMVNDHNGLNDQNDQNDANDPAEEWQMATKQSPDVQIKQFEWFGLAA